MVDLGNRRRQRKFTAQQITVDFGGQQTMISIITSDSARHLGLKKGVDVCALVKATEVMIIRV